MSDYNPDTDPRSSNFLIHEYLASRGIQPNNPNYAQAVRTALAANFANPGMIHNSASTLVNEGPPPAAIAAAAGRGGRSLPVPPIPPEGTKVTVPADRHDDSGNPNTPPPSPPANAGGGGSPTTSAPPTGGGGGGGPAPPTTPPTTGGEVSLWDQILNGIPLNAAPGAASWLLRRFGPNGGGSVNQPGQPDIRLSMNRPEIASQPAQLGGSDATLRLGAPVPGTAPEQRLLAPPEPTIAPVQVQPRATAPVEPVAVPAPAQSATSAAIDKAVPPEEPPAPRARAPRKPRGFKVSRVPL